MLGNAYVTLVTNADFAEGAVALVRSLKLSGTEADIVVMHTGVVGAQALRSLAASGAILLPLALLPLSGAFHHRPRPAKRPGSAPFK